MKTIIQKYPRIIFLLMGFALGMVVVGTNNHWASVSISEFKRVAMEKETRYEELLATSHIKIEELSKTNEKLKQHIKRKTVTLPDGTVTEEIETDTDSTTVTETEIRTSIEIEYERKLTTEREKHVAEINKITNRKLRISGGVLTDLRYYIHGSYSVWGPFSIGGGATSDGTMMIDIGINL